MAVYTYAGRYGPENVIDQSTGRPIPGAAVEVFLRGTSTRAALYLDRTKALSQVNPTAADQRGNLTFFADPGEYDILVNGATLPVTVPIDPAEAAQDVTTGTTAADVLLANKVAGDALNRFEVTAAGVLQWGSGVTALDVNLYRSAADTLKTDDTFVIGRTVTATSKVLHLDWSETVATSTQPFLITRGGVEQFSIGRDGELKVSSMGPGKVGAIIQGAVAQTANLQEWQNSAAFVLAVLSASGNLGIGTASPSDKLTVDGHVLIERSIVADAILRLKNTVDENQIYTHSTSGDLRFWNGADWVTIQSLGNVGIGTMGPGAKLQVNPAAGVIGQIIQANVAQVANLQEWRDSSGAVRDIVHSSGLYRPVVETWHPSTDGLERIFFGAAPSARSYWRGHGVFPHEFRDGPDRTILQLGAEADTGPGQTTLLVSRNQGGVFSLQRVSMGEVDSGGVGFKLLRVPN